MGFLSSAAFHINVLFSLSDHLINMCLVRVIFIRIFQNDTLISNIPKYIKIRHSKKEPKQVVCFVLQAGNNNITSSVPIHA